MALVSLLKNNPEMIGGWSIKQIVNAAGDGLLRDGSDCSKQLRAYLQQVSSERISGYTSQCLTEKFDSSGQILQDLVNELGRRLGYVVENGVYAGRVGAIGNDGLWTSQEGDRIVVEVKTSDAYRVSLDTVAKYRNELTKNLSGAPPSILIVVGRQDTGELEAQVRGSRHAWDIRLISVESLAKLVSITEEADEAETGRKVRSILKPVEYTRVDQLVEVVFAAAADSVVHAPEDGAAPNGDKETLSRQSVSVKRTEILAALMLREGVPYLKNSRAMWWTPDHAQRVVCTISKRYQSGNDYWYAYHPKWDHFLCQGASGRLILGCMDLDKAFVLPLDFVRSWLPHLNTSGSGDERYWHVYLDNKDRNGVFLRIPGQSAVSLEKYAMKLNR